MSRQHCNDESYLSYQARLKTLLVDAWQKSHYYNNLYKRSNSKEVIRTAAENKLAADYIKSRHELLTCQREGKKEQCKNICPLSHDPANDKVVQDLKRIVYDNSDNDLEKNDVWTRVPNTLTFYLRSEGTYTQEEARIACEYYSRHSNLGTIRNDNELHHLKEVFTGRDFLVLILPDLISSEYTWCKCKTGPNSPAPVKKNQKYHDLEKPP